MNYSAPLVRSFNAFIRTPSWWPLLILFWAVVAGASFAWNLSQLEQHAHVMAVSRGRLVFEMIETTRLWAAQHGGVYAPVTSSTQPNPWLETSEKTITSPAGVELTKINPAYMTRQLGDLIALERDLRVHLTSLKLINPDNKPDPWERESLEMFEKNRVERVAIVGDGDSANFRYMAPLEVKKPCMVCHAKLGYQVGDVRGGISVTFPASYVLGIIDAQKRSSLIVHLAAFCILSALAWGSLLVIRRSLLALEAARGELIESEKMASLGRMVAGFAHEVNTPVGVAVGAASQSRELLAELGKLIKQDEVREEDLQQRLEMLDEASVLALNNLQRAASMVQSFKRTAVDQTSEAERDYDLAEVIDDVRKTLHNSFKNTPVRIEIDCQHDVRVFGVTGALEQVLTNLLQNSRIHAFADASLPGLIRIRAEARNDAVHIEFSDDGAGMDAATLAHAFEPFYTTRRGSGGSGLGLYLVYNLVTRGLGGSIVCASQPGQGARFNIEFPQRSAAQKNG